MVFQKLYKNAKESTPSNVADLIYLKGTHRALKGHLRTRRALGYSKNTWGLKALG